jgi:predicted porin
VSTRLGEIRVGREYAPTHFTFCFYEAFGCIGLGGTKMSFDQGSTTYAGAASVLGAAFGTTGGPTANQNPTLRVNNSVQYLLPEGLGGVSGAVMVAPGEGAATSANGNSKVFGGRLGYAAGPFMVNVATMTTRNTLVAGQNFKDNVLMSSYDFGVVKLYAARRTYTFMSEKMVQTVVNAMAPVGAFGRLKVSWAKADQTSAIGTRSADDASLFAVGYDHSLSKRTGLYATVARMSNSGNARYAFLGGSRNIGAGQAANGYELGVRHSF